MRHHDSPVPVNRDERPRERPGDDGLVDEPRIRRVAEVKRGQVDEVEDDEQLGPAEERADEDHDEGEVEEVVDDEVAPHGARRVHAFHVAREEVGDVSSLKDEEDEPVSSQTHGPLKT